MFFWEISITTISQSDQPHILRQLLALKKAQQQIGADVTETVPFDATQVAEQLQSHLGKDEVPKVEEVTSLSRSLAKEFSEAGGSQDSQGLIVFHKSSIVFTKL